jgi:hypothetical protein
MMAAGFSQAPAIEHIVTLVDQLELPQDEVTACVDLVDRQALPRHRAGADACWLAALIMTLRRAAGDKSPAGLSRIRFP